MRLIDVLRFFGALLIFGLLDILWMAVVGGDRNHTVNVVMAAMTVVVWAVRETRDAG